MSKAFLEIIKEIVVKEVGETNTDIIYNLPIIQYLVKKTKSANKGSKSRGSFANLYAVYVLIEDYVNKGYYINDLYRDYDGAQFSQLLIRQRKLPFGYKLQNHALNHRMNEEFKKYFPTVEKNPIIRDADTNKYWFNESFLVQYIGDKKYNLAQMIIKIIDKYIEAKQDAMNNFLTTCSEMKDISKTDSEKVYNFIKSLLAYNVDARLFEIVSYSILKFHYNEIIVFWGFDREEIAEENLKLYKTGRTNANDGGIDFVMRPLGRFFQVTETMDFKKYFLDIDKIERYPITFVVKTEKSIEALKEEIKEKAFELFSIKKVVQKYLESIEELVNIPILIERFDKCVYDGKLEQILDEIITQSKVEFNI